MPLTLAPRPKYKHIPRLAEEQDLVVVLLQEAEGAQDLIRRYREVGLDMLHVPFRVGLTREETEDVRDALRIVAKQLELGTRVFVHCAAGIHRTGTFAYALLRKYDYMTREEALEEIRQLRAVTAEGMERFIPWAEEVLL